MTTQPVARRIANGTAQHAATADFPLRDRRA
jgi:hypothetical protein